MKKFIVAHFIYFLILCNLSTAQTSIFPVNKNTYSCQMHLHGLSNHNAATQPATMQWHSHYGNATGTNVLWFTDHNFIWDQRDTLKFNFINGVFSPQTMNITGLNSNSNNPPMWQGAKTGGNTSVTLTNYFITLSMNADTSVAPYPNITFSPRSAVNVKLSDMKHFNKPLTSLPKFAVDVTPANFTSVSVVQCRFYFYLGYHYYNGIAKQQVIQYQLMHSGVAYSKTLTDSFTLLVKIPVINNQVNHLLFDLAADAAMLRDGTDNAISDLKLFLQAKSGYTGSAKIGVMKLYSGIIDDSSNYTKFVNLGNYYETIYPLEEYIGAEASYNGNQFLHMNGFVDENIPVKRAITSPNFSNKNTFSSNVHTIGGITSYNHAFGVNETLASDSIQDLRTDTIASLLLGNNVYNCDYIEVGYTKRGGANLAHHIKLWDILNANQVFIYGNGTSDSHGSTWYTAENNFVTWVWSSDSSSLSMIDGFKDGRAYFGNNQKWDGKFYFKVGQAEMGDKVNAQHRLEQLKVEMTNIPAGAKFKLTQALITPGIIVTYLKNNVLFDVTNPPCVDLNNPCFIRIAVYDSLNKPLVISNPVYFLTGSGIPNVNCNISPRVEEEKENNVQVSCYPNPVSETMHVMVTTTENIFLKILLYSAEGKFVKYAGYFVIYDRKKDISIPVNDLPPGNYLLVIENNNFRQAEQFVKQ